MGLPKDRRLRQPKEFRHVLSTGRRARDGLVAVAAARRQSADQPTRFGFSVSRRVGGAVTRNRVKRRLREIARVASVSEGWDVVVTAFPPSARSTSGELGASLTKLTEKLGVVEAGGGTTGRRVADDSISRQRTSGGRRRIVAGARTGARPDAYSNGGERRG